MINFQITMKYSGIREDYFDTAMSRLSRLERGSSYYDGKTGSVNITVHRINRFDEMKFHCLKWDIYNILVDMVRKNKTSGNEYFLLSSLLGWMSSYCEEIYDSKTRIANYIKKVIRAVEDDAIGIWNEYYRENDKGTCTIEINYLKAFQSPDNLDCDTDCDGCENKCDVYDFFNDNHHENCPLGMCDE